MIATSATPWNAAPSKPHYLLWLFLLVIAALAFLAGFLRTSATQDEVGSRYRSVVVARLSVASQSYSFVVVKFLRG